MLSNSVMFFSARVYLSAYNPSTEIKMSLLSPSVALMNGCWLASITIASSPFLLLNTNAYSYFSRKDISKLSLRLGSTVIDFSMRGSRVTLNAYSIGEANIV